jgi:tRNA(His) 5'-end guanylyltransferase
MKYDSLGDRMKGYENAYRLYLPRRMPVIIRVDGRAFHTFTRGFQRPFDEVLMSAMQLTAKKLCEEVSGCKLAYVQSDEISLLVTNDDTLETQPWFDNNLQKLTSISASIATLAFNHHFKNAKRNFDDTNMIGECYSENQEMNEKIDFADSLSWTYFKAFDLATFDARAFILPPEEVCNYFIWRQQDAVRNSIQMVAQSLYSHNELQGKNSSDLQELIHAKGVNWNDYPVPCKRGACIAKKEETDGVVRHKWVIDDNIPTFTKNREYIESTFLHKS